MSSRHLLDPQLVGFLELLPTSNLNADTLAETRERVIAMSQAATPAPFAGNISMRHIPGPPNAPDVPVDVYRPNGVASPMPVYLHIHGGGYVMGDTSLADAQNRKRAAELSCLVVSVDYRLAPETPFPGPVEDCYAALLWLHNNAAELGIDPSRIAVGGESAGGGLAAAVALMARDTAEVPIILQMLSYPMLDDRTVVAPEPHPFAGEFIWPPASNAYGWAS